jgi:glycosyltransferase involved in cell wall biosynthesis
MPPKLVVTMPVAKRLGGAENMLWTFLRHHDPARIEPVVVFLQPGPFKREVAELGVRTLTLPSKRLRDTRQAGRTIRILASVLRTERPGLILSWMAKAQLYTAPAAKLARLADRVVWWQHGVPEGHWLDRLATLLPAAAVGCSSQAAAVAQRRLRPHRTTFVVHPGIDVQKVTPDRRAAVRAEASIPPDAVVVGIVGRLQPWKGQDRFIEALAELRRRGHDLYGLVVGGNAYDLSPGFEERLRRKVHELGLEERVVFTGQVEDAQPHIAAMDILVNASAPEPFGLVIVEAMALDVPVVAVDMGGPAEIIESERSGVLVPSNAPDVLADALEQLVVDPDLRRRLGDGGLAAYRDRFTAERMTDSLQAAFERLAR